MKKSLQVKKRTEISLPFLIILSILMLAILGIYLPSCDQLYSDGFSLASQGHA